MLPSFLSKADLSDIGGVPQALSGYLRTNQVWGIANYFGKMTLEQLETLGRLTPTLKREFSWVDAVLAKKFPIISDSSRNFKEIYVNLESILSFIQSGVATPAFERELLRKLLIFGLFTNNFSEPAYIRYLYLRKDYSLPSFYSNYLNRMGQITPEISENELIDEYSFKFFAGKATVPAYDSLFEPGVLSKLIARANILMGNSPDAYGLSAQEISDIAKEVELEIERSNGEIYKANDTVSLKIRRKNVQKLIITLIELNPEAYYRSTLSPLPADLNLDGVVSKHEQTLSTPDNPLTRVFQTLDFPQITNKTGLFIIEIVGNGRHARAVIRKGGLKHVIRPSVAGLLAYIYDSEGGVVGSDETAVVLDGKVYRKSQGKDYVLLPFAQVASVKPLILLGGGMAELITDFQHDSEQYVMRTTLVSQQEGIISDESGVVLLLPRLYINGYSAMLDILENIVAKVVLIDQSGLRSSKTYPGLTLTGKEATIPLDFDAPKGSALLEVELSAEVLEVNTGKRRKLVARNEMTVNGSKGEMTMFDLYLRSEGRDEGSQQWRIEVMGKNGEALANVAVDLYIETLYSSQEQSFTLSSSSTGLISLSQLPSVAFIRAITRGQPSISRSWDLTSLRSQVSYPSSLTITTLDSLDLPIPPTALIQSSQISLFRVTDDYSVIIKTSLPIIENSVKLTGLAEGLYVVKVPGQREYVRVSLRVVAAVRADAQALIGNRRIYPDSGPSLPVGIRTVNVTGNNLSIQLSGAGGGAKVSILLRNYHESTPAHRWQSLLSLQGRALCEVSNPSPSSIYLRSRRMDDELRYILERKTSGNKRGIQYPLPSVLLKGKELEVTVTEVQHGEEGSPFESEEQSAPEEATTAESEAPWTDTSYSPGLFYDFLSTPASVLSQYTADSTGFFSLTSPLLSQFSLLELIVTNQEAAAQAIVNTGVDGTVVGKKDIRLTASLDGMKKFAEVRKIKAMVTGQKLTVKDVSSSTFAIVDSVEKLLRVMIQLGESIGKIDSQGRDWMFLGRWGGLSQSEKESFYSEYVSHELNLFLFRKDPLFFTSIIRPFLSNKLEKTFIDDYLLGNPLAKYEKLEGIADMPVVELALLAQKTRNPHIIAYLSDRKTGNPQSVQHSRWLFDSILRLSLEDSYTPQEAPATQQLEPYSNTAGGPVTDSNSGNSTYAAPEAMPTSAPSPAAPPTAPAPPADPGMGDRGKTKAYYRQLDSTREYTETHYYGAVPNPSSIEFWSDVASGGDLLLPESVVEAHLSLGEVIMAAGLVDLPWTSVHPFAAHGLGFEMTISSNCYIFHRDIQPVPESPLDSIALSQYYSSPILPPDSPPPSEFIQTRPYNSSIVLTNMAAIAVTLEVLIQIPQGSIPLDSFLATRIDTVTIDGYSTVRLDAAFYFPKAGVYSQASVYVSREGKVVKSTLARGLEVKERETELNLDSFVDVARAGNTTAILHYLSTKNLHSPSPLLDFTELNWLLSSPSFFLDVTTVLRSRLLLIPSVWAFSLIHSAETELRELLESQESIRLIVGDNFESRLMSTKKEGWRQLEYFPLVNARAHVLGENDRIANEKFRTTYHRFLRYLADKPSLSPSDRLCLSHYFILQSRFDEAWDQLLQLPPSNATSFPLQLAYLTAYLDPSSAKSLVSAYEQYPVSHWRERFSEIAKQTQEAESWSTPSLSPQSSLSVTVNDSSIQIDSQGLTTAIVKLHQINLEVVFSRSPFLSKSMGACEYTVPIYTEVVNLTGLGVASYRLPMEYSRTNQFIVVEADSYRWAQLYLASGLRVQRWEDDGQLKVTEDSYRPVKNAYVKVYAKRKDGEVRFYKDGYTDERGRFDYASLSTDDLTSTTSFSILISSDSLGATVLEVRPPAK